MSRLRDWRLVGVIMLALTGSGLARSQTAGWQSLDVCSDQYLLALADDHQIAALSPYATNATSGNRVRARDFPTVRASLEQLVARRPAGVVSFWGAGPRFDAALENLSIPHVRLVPENSIDSSLENLLVVGEALDQQERAQSLVDNIREKLGAEPPQLLNRVTAMYVTPGGVTAGKDTAIDDLLGRAGLRNAAADGGETGWPAVRLERLVANIPDVLVRGFVDLETNSTNYWGLFAHRIWPRLESLTTVVDLPSDNVACANWFALSALESLRAAANP